jgi:hypothetical protein
MSDPDLPSERWDEEEPSLRYPHATRRRALIARALAAVGILGTLGLAAAAFAPHLSRLKPSDAPPAVVVQQMPMVAPPPPPSPPPVVAPPAPPSPPPAESEPPPPLAVLEKPPAPEPAASRPSEPTRGTSSSRRSRPEAQLTPREIERRQQRYEMWLRREGLERIH